MNKETIALRVILSVLGFAFVALGLNVALGGIFTLGMQVDPAFSTVAIPADFATQDNHVRFLGGLMTAIGVCLLLATVRFAQFRSLVVGLCFIIGLAGWFRLSQSGLPTINDPKLLQSFIFEVVIFPLIGLWIIRRHP